MKKNYPQGPPIIPQVNSLQNVLSLRQFCAGTLPREQVAKLCSISGVLPQMNSLPNVFSCWQFSVGTLPYSLKCITEARVGFIRIQKEYKQHTTLFFATFEMFICTFSQFRTGSGWEFQTNLTQQSPLSGVAIPARQATQDGQWRHGPCLYRLGGLYGYSAERALLTIRFV